MKTLVIISDTHCGSIYGLTPPEYQSKNSPHHQSLQKEAWRAYRSLTMRWADPDVLLVNGDLIEGRQERQGGAELLTNDRNIQCDMAMRAISSWNAKDILISYGTAYHVGDEAEDFEYTIAKQLKARIEGRLFFELEGLTFDVRHKVGHSSVMTGRANGLLREIMWNLIKEADGNWHKTDVIIRSHTHYHIWVESNKKIAFTTPALQLSRGRYGSRELSGTTHWGAIRLTIHNGQITRREVEICSLLANRPKIYRLG